MATVPETSEDYVARLNRESARLEAETRRLRAEAGKLNAERSTAMAKITWLDKLFDRPALYFLFILVLTISIMGLGATLAKMFLS